MKPGMKYPLSKKNVYLASFGYPRQQKSWIANSPLLTVSGKGQVQLSLDSHVMPPSDQRGCRNGRIRRGGAYRLYREPYE